jgi:hypothetical protein
MKLECVSYYFYPNGVYETYAPLGADYVDIKAVEPSVRIFGTKEQIDEAFNKYVQETGLALDEAYDFEIEDKLKEYEKIYKEKNCKPLIIRI